MCCVVCRCVGEGRVRPRKAPSWRNPKMPWWKCQSRSTSRSNQSQRRHTRSFHRTGSGTRPFRWAHVSVSHFPQKPGVSVSHNHCTLQHVSMGSPLSLHNRTLNQTWIGSDPQWSRVPTGGHSCVLEVASSLTCETFGLFPLQQCLLLKLGPWKSPLPPFFNPYCVIHDCFEVTISYLSRFEDAVGWIW